ncbi:MAG TPA: sigma-70 family RNA polymerase sigma factor [Candidatus Brocadiia bacterium]|mgnify:CR=1 FL=1|nr:sigma-70 family RNA polymerase sigma factor [Candidatus Brocadiia bacterium]
MDAMALDMVTTGIVVSEQTVQAPACGEDAQIVAQAAQGDEAAFRVLVDKYRRVAYTAAYGFLRDEHLARDISQEAFVRVFRGLKRYDPKRPFVTWLRRIVVNLAIDELRRKRRRSELPLEEHLADRAEGDPALPAEAAEQRQAVWEILDQLPLKYRTVMTLREIEGLPTEEVAKVIGRPEVSVRWRLHRARKLFRDLWLARFGAE